MRHYLAALALLVGVTPLSAEVARIDWSDLIDQSAQTYDDPFRELTYEQLEDLRRVVRLTAEVDAGKASKGAETRLSEVKATLAAQGLDADWLISQRWIVAERRELAGAAGNPSVDGEIVVLGGFAIPAPAAEDGTTMAYLVPERGMCSHVPPPPPNQMVRLRLSNGWQPTMIHEPIVVTARIHIDPTEQRMMVVDGVMPMRATFSMDVVEVQTFPRREMHIGAKEDTPSNTVQGWRHRAPQSTNSQ